MAIIAELLLFTQKNAPDWGTGDSQTLPTSLPPLTVSGIEMLFRWSICEVREILEHPMSSMAVWLDAPVRTEQPRSQDNAPSLRRWCEARTQNSACANQDGGRTSLERTAARRGLTKFLLHRAPPDLLRSLRPRSTRRSTFKLRSSCLA